jgi:hypothetical protein
MIFMLYLIKLCAFHQTDWDMKYYETEYEKIE